MIGDMGLLDHLLKYMAGKIAPGGKERFRHPHNPEGLETRGLPEPRPCSATELKELKGKVADMKRELEKLACREKENNQALINVDPLSFEASIKLLKAFHHELMKKKADIEKQLLESPRLFWNGGQRGDDHVTTTPKTIISNRSRRRERKKETKAEEWIQNLQTSRHFSLAFTNGFCFFFFSFSFS